MAIEKNHPVFNTLDEVVKGLKDQAIIIQEYSFWQGTKETTKPGDGWRSYAPNGEYDLRIRYIKPQKNE